MHSKPQKFRFSCQAMCQVCYLMILSIAKLYCIGDRWTNKYEALGEWYWQGKTKVHRKTPVPVPLDTPQIPHGLTWGITVPQSYFWVFNILCSSITLNTHTFCIHTYTKSHCLPRYCLISNEHALRVLHTLKWHTVQEIINYSNIQLVTKVWVNNYTFQV